MKSELTELEIRADQEAEAARIRQLSPEYLAAIENQMGDMHKAQICGEITTEQVALAVLPAIISAKKYDYVAGYILSSFRYADLSIEEMNWRKQKND